MEIKDLIRDLLNTKGIMEWHCCLQGYGFMATYINTDYPSAVEICYSENAGYCVGMMLFPEDKCLFNEDGDEEENEAYDNYVDACETLNWYVMVKHTIEAYVYIFDEQGEEILGYKDFGISDERFDDINERYRD